MRCPFLLSALCVAIAPPAAAATLTVTDLTPVITAT
jgi:hypothetical protein